MTAEIGPHVKATLNFYADDGRLAGDDRLLQSYLDKFLELLPRGDRLGERQCR
jgi:hypothetical protein